jgi:hypothetical protein
MDEPEKNCGQDGHVGERIVAPLTLTQVPVMMVADCNLKMTSAQVSTTLLPPIWMKSGTLVKDAPA